MTIKRVFGEPIETNGITIIPAATVLGGAGGGNGRPWAGDKPGRRRVRAVGDTGRVYVVKGETVTWQPALNLNRVILGGQLVAIALLLTIRSMVCARAVRRPGLSAPAVRSACGWRGRLRLTKR